MSTLSPVQMVRSAKLGVVIGLILARLRRQSPVLEWPNPNQRNSHIPMNQATYQSGGT